MAIHSLSRPASPQLPTFTTPPRSGASTPNRFGGSSPPLGAVAEKIALSYANVQNYRPPPRISRLFTPVRIPLGSRAPPAFGSASPGSPRELAIPVFTLLHPSRPWPFLRTGAASSSGYLSLTKRRANSDIGAVGSNGTTSSVATTPTSALRIIIAILGTALACFLLVLLGFKWMVRPLARLFFHKDSYPSSEPSTLVFDSDEIERVWRWEIASGNYPSSRPVDGPLVQVEVPSRSGEEVEPVRSIKIENPGLARKTSEQLTKEREPARLRAEAETTAAGKTSSPKEHPQDAQITTPPRAELFPIGPGREYIKLPLAGGGKRRSYPPRPLVGSALDMDVVMDHCDFSTRRYVRDCLEVLRINGGLETPLRRGDMSAWRTTFLSLAPSLASSTGSTRLAREVVERHRADMTALLNSTAAAFEAALASRQQLTLTAASAQASPAQDDPDFVRVARKRHSSHPTADPACDPDYPHLFHIFWAGPFTDKPYSAALSFLYTQHLGLDRKMGLKPEPNVCRPQLWIWINPGAASSLPDQHAVSKMRKDLANNPWSAPLLHPRFGDVVKFRLWNTTEQLDGVEEMKGWREMGLFNSGGVKYGANPLAKAGDKVNGEEKKRSNADGSGDAQLVVDDREDKVLQAEKEVVDAAAPDADPNVVQAEAKLAKARELEANSTMVGTSTGNATQASSPTSSTNKDELFERVGSTSHKYDRLTVVLSDMARFVLTHRFGGVYLDADTILLRDWEELFNWHGAFAYRWSRLEKYNTAVLKMQRGSALGNFLFRTAVANDLDFHPMTISRYTKDAGVEGLLLRLPDALFDPAWLNTEYYQRDRPAFPYFQRFEDFFETPAETNAAPNALGFDGFFKGAFSYHFHNFWWIPFDAARNWPDLGERFVKGERIARGRVRRAQLESMEEASEEREGGDSGKGRKKGEEKQAIPIPKWGDDEKDFESMEWADEDVEEDAKDLSWSAVLKRTFEAFIRGETPNMYGEWLNWEHELDEGDSVGPDETDQ
ncbi:BQ5605_C015g07923 [Microbotryum silenes-dioicae]|uniref:BQ5605_C015g07923 protein n=1 Tax=Microbotryum silenes-dioicae TaxID=796604 RepID=A0A2X0LTM1_9BASI|nr:BQ5605_C015g07923 [Microbotryum silenes-dioicae]